MKENSADWVNKSFIQLTTIKDVKHLWELLNNVPNSITGKANLFIMENDLLPLWEHNKDLFERGGCWSTIIRGHPWKTAMNEIFMALVGEMHFDEDNVRGLCVVPVSYQHCIIKIWVRRTGQSTAKTLEAVLKDFGCCTPRFKAFT